VQDDDEINFTFFAYLIMMKAMDFKGGRYEYFI